MSAVAWSSVWQRYSPTVLSGEAVGAVVGTGVGTGVGVGAGVGESVGVGSGPFDRT